MAGTWSTANTVNGVHVTATVLKLKYEFTADAAAATIPDKDTEHIEGFLAGVRVKFGTTAPNSLTVAIKDEDGITIASGVLTATGTISIMLPEAVRGKLTISLSGNTTNSATGTVILLLI